MAKFKDLSLDLETGEHIDFDDADTIMMGYDGAELYLTSTLSGVRAVQPYHMVRYDQLTEASGTLKNYIDEGLEAQDEFIELTDTPPTYSGSENKYLKVTTTGIVFDYVDHGELTGLTDDDHPQYVPRDGSRGFTSTVSGVYPIEYYDLVTLEYLKDYVLGTGAHLFGDNFFYTTSISISSTNSTTFIEKLKLTASGIPEGSYRVGWSFEWRMSKQNESFTYRVQLDDSINLGTNTKSPFVDVNEYQLIANFYYMPVLVSGTHTIDVDFHSSNSGATAYIQNVKIEFWRVG